MMRKKLNRLFMISIFTLCFITGCSVSDQNSDKENSSNSNDKEKVQYLNVTQADLISQVTGNEKYLNPNLLYDIDRLEDTDKINIIFTLDTRGTIDSYFDNNRGYASIGEYSTSDIAKEMTIDMEENQRDLASHLLELGYIDEVLYSYTTLFNGFSAATTYGDYQQMVKLGLAKNIAISEVYAQPKTTSSSNTGTVENLVDVYETGIFNSSTVKYDGENTAVAILDSGFDVHHTVFRSMPKYPMISKEEVDDVINKTTASELTAGLKTEDVYVNTKIPFAYDYADKDPDVTPFTSEHGTHVAGIIGGDDDVITGVAVNTQLVLLKVFGDLVEGATTEAILAALEDAVLLGVDAINMSLGTSCGFSTLYGDDPEDVYTNLVYNKIEQAGISLVVAASNDYSSAYGGEESNTNKVTNPDSATVGSPSTYTSALSVASISGTKSKYIVADDGYSFFFHEANSAGAEPYDFYEMLNLPENEDVTYEYVAVPGNGIQVNYSSIDVKGKVALVKRGDNSFEDKAKIAYEHGAIACIVYNNIGGDIVMSAGNNLKIPFCSISKDDGVHLAARKRGKLTFNKQNQAGPFMSDFSSWGPNPDLTLKPEITAHGGNIKSSVPGGGYDELSGTSMASPNMCGIVVLIRQYLKEKYPNYSAKDISTMTNQLLMSSATIALNENGNVYSPRKQGAGLASLRNAVNTKAYLTVDGIDRAKIELGDDPNETGVYTLKFNLNNMSSETLTYQLSDYTMTESVTVQDKDFVSEKSYYLNPTSSVKVSGNGNLNGSEVTVNPNGVAKIEYTITLSEEDKKYIRSNFTNGMYVEGFATLDSKNADEIDLNIPYLTFFGDWTVAPMFDKTFYEVETTAHDGALDEEDKIKADYYATTPLGTYYYNYIIPLGSYLYTIDENQYQPIPATEEHAAISYEYDTINGITCIYAGLLRNAKKMTTTIKNTITGEVVYERVKYNQLKAHANGGTPVPSFDMLDINIQELGLSNNVNYTFTMTGELDYGDGGVKTNLNNSFSFSFYVDIETPLITDAQFRANYDKTLKKDRYYIDVFVYDNHYVQSIRPFTVMNGKMVDLSHYPTPVYGEKGSVTKVTMEVTDYMDLLQYSVDAGEYQGAPNGFGFMVDDYAMNDAYYFVNFPGTDSDELKFVNEEGNRITTYTTRIGEEVDLAKMLISSDEKFNQDDTYQSEYMSKLAWKSSNEKVLRVHNGKIEGISAGIAVITATALDSSGNKNSVTLSVIVQKGEQEATDTTGFQNDVSLKEINFTYFDTLKAYVGGPEYSEIGETGDRIFFTSSPSISCYPSEKVQIGYEIKPWNLDPSRYTLKWTSTNPAVATVNDEGIVEAKKEGSATIMLRITVDGKQSNLLASSRITVKNEFIIEGGILTGYKGLGGDVVIPDDKGIMYIGSYAFSLYTTDRDIKVDEDDWDANKTAAGNDAVTSVVIPGNVMEVQKYAFFNCPNLKKVEFQKTNKGDTCKIIKEYAFYKNTSLTDINFDDIQIVGASAFQGCTSLASINTSKLYAVGTNAFKGCTALTSLDLTSLRNAWANAFADCTSLTSITTGPFTKFSEGMFKNTDLREVTIYADRIPNSTFENCKNLASVTIENNIVYVGASAFKDCTNLEDVTIKGSCDFIYNNAFNNTGITSITLPNSAVSLEEDIFLNCSKLTTVKFGDKTEIKDSLGTTFKDCLSLGDFEVDAANPYYQASNSLLLNKDGSKLIFAAPSYEYGEYSIPDSITQIASGAFSAVNSLSSLNLNQVTAVEDYAFKDCLNLTTVTFAEKATSIGNGAFANCTALATLVNSNHVTKIAEHAFDTTAVSSVVLGDNVVLGAYAFANNKALTSVTLGNNTVLEEGAFSTCATLATIDNGTGLKIGAYAFEECVQLNTIDLSKAVGTIGEGAFYHCQSLTSVALNEITRVEAYAFADCSKLATITLSKVEYIGTMAFAAVAKNSSAGCAVETIVLPNTLQYLGEGAFFKCKQLKSVKIDSNCEMMEAAFAECSSLQTVTLNDAINNIKDFTFYNDVALTTINLGNVETIGDSAFYQCGKLEDADLSKAVEIGVEAFYSCNALTDVTLNQATILEDSAFLNCANIASITLPKVEYIGAQALSMLGVTTIELPNTVQYVAPTAFYQNNKLTAFTFEGNSSNVINDYAKLENGVLYTKTAKGQWALSSYPTAKVDETFEVAADTVYIELFAAARNSNLKKIILPDTLKMIGNMAFFGCNQLETVEFRSTTAPILESSPLGTNSDYDYKEDSAVYKLLSNYLNFNGFYPYYYGHFKSMVGTSNLLNLILPANDNLVGYDHIMFTLYFDLEHAQKSDTISRDTNTLNFLEKIQYVPTEEVTLQDEDTIVSAKTAWNALKQDLTQFGYTQEELDGMLKKIESATAKLEALKTERVRKKYSVLVQEIQNLGSFELSKMDTYERLVGQINVLDKEEKKYIDTTILDDFKKAYDALEQNVNDDIIEMDKVSEIPSQDTANRFVYVVALSQSISLCAACILLGKYWL